MKDTKDKEVNHPHYPEAAGKQKIPKKFTPYYLLQIALQFPYRFWDNKIQGADYFGHIPPVPEKRGMFSVFYDMDPQVGCVSFDKHDFANRNRAVT